MESLIQAFGLKPHPEGGYYREVYRSQEKVLSPKNGKPRQALTHIYYLLQAGDVSRFHRVSHDEVWNFYAGAPLLLHETDGHSVNDIKLGPGQPDYCWVVQGGLYQAARSTGEYSLVGCSVAPGFDFADFNFIQPQSQLDYFIRQHHPQLSMFL
ncbi:cupin domain-containing protein [Aliiglaciecola sp. CAU 1673]|uniref:cupin domain-containing protein n=1 Tax=Aliiglaciecola sp. CAU 1673 TaxID=3032595 RepID=UPI0023DA26EC|nr:cupin domain-containing protein [Aliiglaciecola sp. CAU 1673]MDF2177835.1 cupin domain-containing protein [Aliiglaciecola sp. CAU 1673]